MEYKCSVCGKTGVKLWIDYQTFHFDLYCVDCAKESQGVEYEVYENGKHENFYKGESMGMTDQIRWLVPAVPVENEPESFWGYTSVPQDRIIWWEKLPLK